MFYSFDDTGIGLTKDNNFVVEIRVKRPHGLSQNDWYLFAFKICKELNKSF